MKWHSRSASSRRGLGRVIGVSGVVAALTLGFAASAMASSGSAKPSSKVTSSAASQPTKASGESKNCTPGKVTIQGTTPGRHKVIPVGDNAVYAFTHNDGCKPVTVHFHENLLVDTNPGGGPKGPDVQLYNNDFVVNGTDANPGALTAPLLHPQKVDGVWYCYSQLDVKIGEKLIATDRFQLPGKCGDTVGPKPEGTVLFTCNTILFSGGNSGDQDATENLSVVGPKVSFSKTVVLTAGSKLAQIAVVSVQPNSTYTVGYSPLLDTTTIKTGPCKPSVQPHKPVIKCANGKSPVKGLCATSVSTPASSNNTPNLVQTDDGQVSSQSSGGNPLPWIFGALMGLAVIGTAFRRPLFALVRNNRR